MMEMEDQIIVILEEVEFTRPCTSQGAIVMRITKVHGTIT